MLLVAGKVNTAIGLPYLDKGDILIDGGNTYFLITEDYRPKGFTFFGMGIRRRKKEFDLVLCLAVIKNMKLRLSLNP
jgi:6-phosphogluconate dehydrogenase (decarboxylating)